MQDIGGYAGTGEQEDEIGCEHRSGSAAQLFGVFHTPT
jgi:hypothetical protein